MSWTDIFAQPGAAAAAGIGAQIAGNLIRSHAASGASQAAQTANANATAQLQPYLQSGEQASLNLATSMAPGGDLYKTFDKPFVAPAYSDIEKSPDWNARIAEGEKAILRARSAMGGVASGATGKALERFGQDEASKEYDKIYGRAKGEWESERDTFNANQNQRFNRLNTLSGEGQLAAGNAGSLAVQRGADIAGATATRGSLLGDILTKAGGTLAGYPAQIQAQNQQRQINDQAAQEAERRKRIDDEMWERLRAQSYGGGYGGGGGGYGNSGPDSILD